MIMLRSDWVVTTVDKLGEVVSGGTPSTKVGEFWGGDIVWITPADLSDFTGKRISRGARTITKKGLATSSARLMPPGTIVFSSRAPIGYVAIADVELCTNQGFKSLIPANGVNSDYLYYYFRYIKNLAENRASGTTFKELSMKAFASLPVVVAPSVEQRAIVAKIEALFSELDKSVELLKTVKQQLKQYRQAVLKAAFEGKLTAEWRSKQQAAGRPLSADQLLEQITKARDERHQQLVWKASGDSPRGRSRPVMRKITPLRNGAGGPDLGALPEGWVWLDLGAVGDVSGGITKNSKRAGLPHRFPYLRVANVYANRLDLSDIAEIGVTEAEYAKALLEVDDVLFVEGNGSLDSIGRVAIWNGPISPCLHQNHLIKCRPVLRQMGRFILYWFLSPRGRRVIIDKASSTSGLYTLSISKVSSLPIPVPSLAEQQRIVEEIESRFSVLDELEKAVDQGLQRAEVLRQSILKKAFEGRLLSEAELAAVRNDPEYEPADMMLERIRAEGKQNARQSMAKRTRTTAQPNSRRRSEKSAEETVNSAR